MLDAVALVLSLALGEPRAVAGWLVPAATFRPDERAVSDWRWQAAAHLDAAPGTRAAILLGRDPVAVTRCVRLNNYWCIKRGGWSGEIAADRDGHVAFASAAEGAAVAALLLRRYYMDYGRRSALAIVSHWAPASCGGDVASGGALRSRGYAGTLRARWLAAHGHRVAGAGRGRGRASSVPDRLIGAATPSPAIALGLGPGTVPLSAALPDALAGDMRGGAPPVPACAAEGLRIGRYAERAAAGLAPSITADLALFDAAGRPTPRLARLMRNMAAVEIGPLGAGEALVEAAVARAAAAVAARGAPAPPGARPPTRLDEPRPPEPRP